MKLNILTRCTRTENLEKIHKSIFHKKSNWNIKWTVIFDASVLTKIDTDIILFLNKNKISYLFLEGLENDTGHTLINILLDEIENNEFIYILDDDNILHEDFLEETYKHLSNSNYEGIIFSQYVGKKDFTNLEIREAAHENVKVSKIDFAQFLLKRSLIGDLRLEEYKYIADGIFIEKLYNENINKFIIINKVLCYYNYLQKDLPYSLPRISVSGISISELKTIKHTSYESDELYLLNPTNDKIIDTIYNENPDYFITVGDSYSQYVSLGLLPYDFRQRWIHLDNDDNLGEIAYNATMNSILSHDTTSLISIFTSLYKTGKRLNRTYESVRNQTHSNWEWVLMLDSEDKITRKTAEQIAINDPRVKVYEIDKKTKGIIGEAKYRACVLSRGDYLFELDHDDYLTPDALELMFLAFDNYPEAGFVYSDCAEIDEKYNSLTYGPGFALGYGRYREETHFNKKFKVAVAPNINPLTVRHIVGVPNHFRAWRRDVYFEAGCHNRRLSITDDYELILRTFLVSEFVKIDRCCYLQFFDGGNAQNSTRADIQRRVRYISRHYNERIKERFEELGKIDWAYNKQCSVKIKSKFGDDEQYVNKIMSI